MALPSFILALCDLLSKFILCMKISANLKLNLKAAGHDGTFRRIGFYSRLGMHRMGGVESVESVKSFKAAC
ncbi:MAG: hypothetical protein PVI00_15260 [Desulfobacterales bacterium]|jgi:hypothetical protein